jgi:hypothetical protein
LVAMELSAVKENPTPINHILIEKGDRVYWTVVQCQMDLHHGQAGTIWRAFGARQRFLL